MMPCDTVQERMKMCCSMLRGIKAVHPDVVKSSDSHQDCFFMNSDLEFIKVPRCREPLVWFVLPGVNTRLRSPEPLMIFYWNNQHSLMLGLMLGPTTKQCRDYRISTNDGIKKLSAFFLLQYCSGLKECDYFPKTMTPIWNTFRSNGCCKFCRCHFGSPLPLTKPTHLQIHLFPDCLSSAPF